MIMDCGWYSRGVRQAEATTVAEAVGLARDGAGFVWLAISDPDPEELAGLGAAFDLPSLAIEDALEGHQRPKLEEYDDCVFVVMKTVRYDPAEAQMTVGELAVFLGPRSAIVVSRAATDALGGARLRLDEHPAVADLGPMAGLWAVLDTVVDEGERVADHLVDHGERIEQAVFEGDGDQSEPIYVHHRRVERLGRAIHPALAIFDTLERGESVESPQGVRPFFRDVGDHARRLSEEVMMLSNRLDGLLNANLAKVTMRQNVIIQQVSGWAAIAAVPTVITGIYGMNFRRFPELGWPFGYPLALLLMVVAVVALRWQFRRVGWL